jgi:hypothetical protein
VATAYGPGGDPSTRGHSGRKASDGRAHQGSRCGTGGQPGGRRRPPLYLDLPFKNGEAQPDILAKWAANAPLAFIDQYIGNLRQYRAIAIDVGDQDGLRTDTAKLHDVLDKYSIANSFELYHGTHTSAVADRFQNHVMPFFSKNLCFQANCP